MTKNKKIWKQVVYKIGVWITAEIWLNLIGLDNIADYSEFTFAQDLDINLKNDRKVKITQYPPQFCPQVNDFCPIPPTVANPTDLAEDSCKVKVEIFKNKCQQLAQPCLKIVCFLSSYTSNIINQP